MTHARGTATSLDAQMREKLLLPILQESGRQAAAWASLHADVQFYMGRDVHGFVPFARAGTLALGLGEPICRPESRAALAAEFIEFARAQGGEAGFFPVSGSFLAKLAPLGLRGVTAAVEPVLFLDGFSLAAPRRRKLRQMVKRAEHAGVACEMKFGVQLDAAEEEALRDLEQEWYGRRSGAGPQFMFAPAPFTGRAVKRYSVAWHDGAPCAFAALAPLPGRNGWTVEGLFRRPDAPAGASEALLAHMLAEFRDEGFSLVTFGMSILAVPRQRSEVDSGLEVESRTANSIFRWLYAHAPELLNYRSAHRFKQKFLPDRVESCYFAFQENQPSADRLQEFLSVVFRAFDFKGLIQELWTRLSSQPLAETLLPEQEEV